MVEQTQTIAGGCHCGNLRLELRWPAGAETMPARACGCSFCTKHGGLWTSHPGARLVLRIADAAQTAPYRFGTGTADFHVCSTCGAVPAVTCELDGRASAVVNVNCLDGIDPATLERAPTSRARPRPTASPAAARAGSPTSRSRPGATDRRAVTAQPCPPRRQAHRTPDRAGIVTAARRSHRALSEVVSEPARSRGSEAAPPQDLGDLAGARAAFERALAIVEKFLPADHQNLAKAGAKLRSITDQERQTSGRDNSVLGLAKRLFGLSG